MFGDYQGLREEQPQQRYNVTIPTVKMRTGDFSEILGQQNSAQPVNAFYVWACPNPVPSGPAGAIYDPTSCTQWNYGGPHPNVIDPSHVSKAGLNYLNAFPQPNQTNADGTPAIFNNYTAVPEQTQRFDDFDIRLDAKLTAKDMAFARYSYGQDVLRISSLFQNLPAGYGAGYNPTHPRGVAAGETHIFTPHIVNEVLYGFTRDYYAYVNPESTVPVAQNLGIPSANRSPREMGLSEINGGPFGTGDAGPYEVPQKSQEIADNLIWTRGLHTLRFGANYQFHDVQYFQIPCAKQCFNFSSDFTGFAIADILTGFVDSYSVGIGTPSGNVADTQKLVSGWMNTSRMTGRSRTG